MMDIATLISFTAGSLVAIAALPKILDRVVCRSIPFRVSRSDLLRDLLIVAGNGLWVAFGFHQGIPALVVFGGISASLTGILIVQNLQALGRDAKPR